MSLALDYVANFDFNLIKHILNLMGWAAWHEYGGVWGVFGSLLNRQKEKEREGPLKREDKGTKVELLLQNLPRLPFEEQIRFLSESLNI